LVLAVIPVRPCIPINRCTRLPRNPNVLDSRTASEWKEHRCSLISGPPRNLEFVPGERLWRRIHRKLSPTIKRTLGEKVKVRTDILTDGHDAISGLPLFRHESASRWRAAHLVGFPYGKWKASFKVTELGRYVYTLYAWLGTFNCIGNRSYLTTG
jgi:hypothetical protein